MQVVYGYLSVYVDGNVSVHVSAHVYVYLYLYAQGYVYDYVYVHAHARACTGVFFYGGMQGEMSPPVLAWKEGLAPSPQPQISFCRGDAGRCHCRGDSLQKY